MEWLEFANKIENNASGIYCIRNIVDNKAYIGISTDLKFRIRKHYHTLCGNKHHNKHLQNSVNMHGIKSFTVELLELVNEEKLLIKENFYQQLYKSIDPQFGYNVLLTDINGKIRHSSESKLKIGLKSKGRVLSKEARERLSITLSGRIGTPHTEEHKKHMNSIMKGRPKSAETKLKFSLARLGKPNPNKGIKLGPQSKELIERLRLTRIGSLNGRAVKLKALDGTEYGTIKEAAENLNLHRIDIKKLIKNGKLIKV